GSTRIPGGVALRAIRARVNLAIYFNCQPCLSAVKVEHEAAGGVLPTKFQPVGPSAELAPEDTLGQRHGLAQLSGKDLRVFRAVQHVATTPPPRPAGAVPLPLRGRNYNKPTLSFRKRPRSTNS